VPYRERTGPQVAATLVTGFLLTVLSTTVLAWWAVGPLRLQPLVVVMVWAGFNLPLWPGGVVVLFLGYLNDLLSGGVVGLQLTAYMVVFAACALARRKLEISGWPLQMATVGVMSLVSQLLVVVGLSLLHRAEVVPANLVRVVLVEAVLSALTAPLFFALLEAVVRLSQRLIGDRRAGA